MNFAKKSAASKKLLKPKFVKYSTGKFMNPSARRQARYYALQAMYQANLSGDSARVIEAQFLEHQIKKKVDLDYFKELLHAALEKQNELDELMKPYLKRSVNELDPIELSILRISIYELVHRPDVPYRVVINEALELTKKFGSVEGYKFVNGVLDKAARQIRKVEVTADTKKVKDE
jgi:N utilization substance protein B